jgi:hypothetical protein
VGLAEGLKELQAKGFRFVLLRDETVVSTGGRASRSPAV